MTSLKPLEWGAPAKKAGGDTFQALAPFIWPNPPDARFPAASAQTEPLACEIIGLNDKHMLGRMSAFIAEEAVAHVQMPPARATVGADRKLSQFCR